MPYYLFFQRIHISKTRKVESEGGKDLRKTGGEEKQFGSILVEAGFKIRH